MVFRGLVGVCGLLFVGVAIGGVVLAKRLLPRYFAVLCLEGWAEAEAATRCCYLVFVFLLGAVISSC